MHLKDLLTPTNPLGPFRHDLIIKRSWASDGNESDEGSKINNPAPNTLIYQTNAFDEIFDEGRPIIIGRRGSGKTSIVAGLIAQSGQDHYAFTRGGSANLGEDIYVFINAWDHLDQIIEKVGHDSQYSMGSSHDWNSLPPETVARHWRRRLWMVVFDQVYKDCYHKQALRSAMSKVIKFVEGRDILSSSEEITSETISRKFSEARDSIISYLRLKKAKCYIVIDSLEEYPINALRFQRLIAGFLKCVNDLNEDHNKLLRVICCIPEEIEPFFSERSSNQLKDLSPTSSVSRIRWKPIDLLRIVAMRYREFIYLNAQRNDHHFIKIIENLDLSKRSCVERFYSLVMPDTVVNRLGRSEPAISYIIRHTQLLPREFLMIFDTAITMSHKAKGSWRFIEPAAIVKAVETQEPYIAKQIMSPYKFRYAALLEQARECLPELPPLCSMSELDTVIGRIAGKCKHETDHPRNALFEIGILGYIEEISEAETSEHYDYGYFHFNSLRPITFSTGRRYCVHPIFSGSWTLRNRTPNMKCIYPAEVEENPWIEE